MNKLYIANALSGNELEQAIAGLDSSPLILRILCGYPNCYNYSL